MLYYTIHSRSCSNSIHSGFHTHGSHDITVPPRPASTSYVLISFQCLEDVKQAANEPTVDIQKPVKTRSIEPWRKRLEL